MNIREFEERKKKRMEKPTPLQQDELQNTLNTIKKRIAVWSGKGGVGKTTVAINLALALAEKAPTGLLDADIDCPNVSLALGVQERLVAQGGRIQPLVIEDFPNLQIVSMGSIIGQEAVIWRGPMISAAIEEFVYKVNWKVDQLVLDMPPGSSDAALTVAQMLRPHGVVMVTTSDAASMADTRRSMKFAKKLRLWVYGVVENMRGDVFGSGGGERLAQEFNVPFLGALSLDKRIPQYVREHRPLHTTEWGEVFRKTVATVENLH